METAAIAAARTGAAYVTASTCVAARISTASIAVCAVAVTAAIAISVAATITVAVAAAAIAPVIPGARTDKDAAREPARPVIAIRRAGIRIIRIVAPIAGRRTVSIGRGNHSRTHSNTDRNLGMSCSRERHSQKHCQ
jgi:hypothetical protein